MLHIIYQVGSQLSIMTNHGKKKGDTHSDFLKICLDSVRYCSRLKPRRNRRCCQHCGPSLCHFLTAYLRETPEAGEDPCREIKEKHRWRPRRAGKTLSSAQRRDWDSESGSRCPPSLPGWRLLWRTEAPQSLPSESASGHRCGISEDKQGPAVSVFAFSFFPMCLGLQWAGLDYQNERSWNLD